MYKTILIEGGDGVGKTTLAKATAKKITEKYPGYEGFYTRFPSDAIAGFRTFFLNQKGCRPLLEGSEVTWSSTYVSRIPPLSNLLHILADFSYAYAALRSAPDVEAAISRGAVPVFVIDREILSTIVYQIMYAFDQNKAGFDYIIAQKAHLFAILRAIVSDTVTDTQHDLLVHVAPGKRKERPVENNAFDLYDQQLIQKHFAGLFEAMQSGSSKALPFLEETPAGSAVSNLTWLRGRFKAAAQISAFTKSSDALSDDLAALFMQKITADGKTTNTENRPAASAR